MIEMVVSPWDIEGLEMRQFMWELKDDLTIALMAKSLENFDRAPKMLRWADRDQNDLVVVGFQTEADAVMFVLAQPPKRGDCGMAA